MAYIILLLMFFLLNLLSALSLIFIERKEPTTTWAWLIILIALPGIGFILYLLLGQNLSRQKIFREKKLADKIKRYKLRSNHELPSFDSEINENYEDLILMNYNHSGAVYTTGNEVKTYINGEDKFRDLFNDMVPYLRRPDLMIYLDGSLDSIIHRINLRGRDMEKTVDIEYWENLHNRYEKWISEYDQSPVLYVNINEVDLINNPEHLDMLCEKIKEILGM